MRCTLAEQGTRHTGLFWDMDNWSWLRGEDYNSSVNFKVSVNIPGLIYFLSPPCNFWLIFKHFPTKILFFLQPVKSKTTGIGNFKDRFLKITPEKQLKVLYTNVLTFLKISIKAESVLLTMILKTCFTKMSLSLTSFYQKCHLSPVL